VVSRVFDAEVAEVWRHLSSAKAWAWSVLVGQKASIPEAAGVYTWTWGEELWYIGQAAGQDGLRGRIGDEHLRAGYLESRQKKWPPGHFQRSCPTTTVRSGKAAIDQSYFRLDLADRLRLAPGMGTPTMDGTLSFIIEHLSVRWATIANLAMTTPIEVRLIELHCPVLNKRHNIRYIGCPGGRCPITPREAAYRRSRAQVEGCSVDT
jgi:hypothetical protein